MGLFYTNFTVFGPEQRRVLDALRDAGFDAYVSPTVAGFTTVYDREAEGQDFEVIECVGGVLSCELECPVLGIALHDDDVLFYWLFRRGESVDFYNSCPDYFDPNADGNSLPEGGDSGALCDAFGRGDATAIEQILREDVYDDEAMISCEEERHQALVEALGMPIFPVGLGYNGIDLGYLPNSHVASGLSMTDYVRAARLR